SVPAGGLDHGHVRPRAGERRHARAPAAQRPPVRARGRTAHQGLGSLPAIAREGCGLNAEQAFEHVVTTLTAEPGVTLVKAFHNPGLKIGSKLFAMLHPDGLVVKLPEARCRELLANGDARVFDR